jgi:hypothetical protein
MRVRVIPCVRTLSGASAIVLLILLCGRAAEPTAKELPPDVTRAWKQAGGDVGWMNESVQAFRNYVR